MLGRLQVHKPITTTSESVSTSVVPNHRVTIAKKCVFAFLDRESGNSSGRFWSVAFQDVTTMPAHDIHQQLQ